PSTSSAMDRYIPGALRRPHPTEPSPEARRSPSRSASPAGSFFAHRHSSNRPCSSKAAVADNGWSGRLDQRRPTHRGRASQRLRYTRSRSLSSTVLTSLRRPSPTSALRTAGYFATVVLLVALLASLDTSAAPGIVGAAAPCTSSSGPGIAPPARVPSGIPGFHAAWYGQSG